MPLNPMIPLQVAQPQTPNLLGMFAQAQQIKNQRANRQLATRQEKRAEEQAKRQAAAEQRAIQEQQRKIQMENSKMLVNTLGPLSSEWNKQDEEDRIFNTPKTIEYLNKAGLNIDPNTPTQKLNDMIGFAGQQWEGQRLTARGAPKYTITQDAQGNVIRVPHEGGAEAEQVLRDGDPVKKGYAPKTPIAGEDDFFTFNQETEEWEPTGITPKGSYKKQLAWARQDLDQMDFDLKKEQRDRKLTQGQAQKLFSIENSNVALDSLSDAAGEIKSSPALKKITGWRGLIWDRPGGPAADLRAQLNTLESKIAFTVLQNMRNGSKTGGALGQVSEREIDFLKNNLAALKTSQSKEAFRQNLDKIVAWANRTKSDMIKAYDTGWNTVQKPNTETNAIESGEETPWED